MKICSKCGNGKVSGNREYCFGCFFWYEVIESIARGSKRYMICDGICYIIAPPAEINDPFIGSGGRTYVFSTMGEDPRVIESRNVWYHGPVPDYFRNELPDNAIMLY